jgi:release factor glutamine methyltransferase
MTAFQEFVTHLVPTYGESEARSMGRIVFEDALNCRYPYEILPSTELQKKLDDITCRLLAFEPLQYILGSADFYGLKFKADRRALIPRPETEELVEWTVKSVLEKFQPGATVRMLDIGTGSGCIPITIKKYLPATDIWAIDISRDALELAQINADQLEVEVQFRQVNILREAQWVGLPQFHVIVSNPPYIPQSEKAQVPDQVKDHEPHLALFVADEDPLVFYTAISKFAWSQLLPEGLLFFECNEFNAAKVVELLENKGFQEVELCQDLSGKDRMVRAKRRYVFMTE